MADIYDGPREPHSDSDSDIDIENILEADNTKKKGWSSKQKLIKICQQEVGQSSTGRRPLNIAVIGPPGCGKSSLLNTIFASFSEKKWRELAEHGSFGELGRQVSKFLISYPKEKYYINQDDDDEVLMPTFIDMNGFEDSNSDYNKELLKIVFYGRLEEYEKFADVEKCYHENGLNGLKTRYGERNEYLKVDRIIFVCSGDPMAPLPTELMECVCNVARGDRGIPIYGVLTKADKFNGKKNSEVQLREETFRKHLGIPLNRFARIKNYCEDIDKELKYRFSVIPQIDVKILELMTQVFSSSLPVINPDGDPYKQNTDMLKQPSSNRKPTPQDKLPPSQVSSGSNIGSLLMLVTVQMLLLAFVLHFIVTPPINEVTLNKICANYDMIKAKHKDSIEGLDGVCANKINILKPPVYSLGVAVTVAVVLPALMYAFLNRK